MLPKAIIFDLDDTIISLKGTANRTWKIMCKEYCLDNSGISPEILYNTITKIRLAYWNDKDSNARGRANLKMARREIISEVFTLLNLPSQDTTSFADRYSVRRLEEVEVFPNALNTLEILNKKGIILSLITNGETEGQRYKINKFSLSKYFYNIQVEGEVGYGKPDSRIYENALKKMGVEPNQTWSIGDNLVWDVEAPQKLGIYSIWNDFEKMGLKVTSKIKPDRIISSIYELLE